MSATVVLSWHSRLGQYPIVAAQPAVHYCLALHEPNFVVCGVLQSVARCAHMYEVVGRGGACGGRYVLPNCG